MDYETRRNIATILAAVSGVVWIICIAWLAASRCGSAWAWVEAAFIIVATGVPTVIGLKKAWERPESCTGIDFLWIRHSELKDPEGLWLVTDSVVLLWITILTSSYVLMEAFDGSTFWEMLFVVSLLASPLAIGYSIWTAIRISKHNKQ